MKLLQFTAFFLSISATLLGQSPVGENATIQLPAGWTPSKAEGIEFVASNQQDTISVVILRENGEEIETANVQEYYAAKIENLTASLTDFKPLDKKEGEINGLKAAFTVATSKIDQGGKKVDGKMYLMMYAAGNGDFYMTMIATSPRLFDANSADLMKILKSFKVK